MVAGILGRERVENYCRSLARGAQKRACDELSEEHSLLQTYNRNPLQTAFDLRYMLMTEGSSVAQKAEEATTYLFHRMFTFMLSEKGDLPQNRVLHRLTVHFSA